MRIPRILSGVNDTTIIVQALQVYPSKPLPSNYIMLSCENISRTPSPSTASESSTQNRRFEAIKNHNKMPRSYGVYNTHRKNCGNLWVPVSGWIPYYRCSACREVMSRKIPNKCPQKIQSCEHIVCANCIVKSYLIEHNSICPVKNCGKCVNYRATSSKPTATLPLFFTESFTTYVPEDTITEEDNEYHLPSNLFDDDEPFVIERIHYCGDTECEWDCGVLSCGCIDVCRGRCGFGREYSFGHW